MKRILVGAALAAAAALPLGAQEPVTSGRGSLYVGPYVGYMVFGDLLESQDGRVETSLKNSALYGAQVGYSFTPNVTLLGNLGYTKSNFTVEFDPSGGASTSTNISDKMGVFLYDANLQFRLPFGDRMAGWIAPLAQVGAGAIKYTFDTDDLRSRGRTDIAFNAGLGADFQLAQGVGLRLMAKDYITSFKWDRPSTANDPNDWMDDVKGNVAHNWGLSLGLNIGF
jgi:opacity protein-like surface antigen